MGGVIWVTYEYSYGNYLLMNDTNSQIRPNGRQIMKVLAPFAIVVALLLAFLYMGYLT